MLVSVTQTPVIATAAYAAARQLGSVMTFANAAEGPGKGGRVLTVLVTDTANQKSAVSLWLFRNLPTITSTDNTAFNITAANLLAAESLGFVSLAATDYVSGTAVAVGYKPLPAPGSQFVAGASAGGAGTTGVIYGLLQCLGTPTYGATNALAVTLLIDQDD